MLYTKDVRLYPWEPDKNPTRIDVKNQWAIMHALKKNIWSLIHKNALPYLLLIKSFKKPLKTLDNPHRYIKITLSIEVDGITTLPDVI